MKKSIILISAIFLLFSSCEFNQSVNKDFITGAYSRGDGLGVDNVELEIDGMSSNRTDLIYGEEMEFIFQDVTGFKKVNGKVFPGLTMYIVEGEKKDTVMSYPNLLEDIEGTDLSPLQVKANFVAALPCHNNEKYRALITIWDQKGEGTFTYEVPFTLRRNERIEVNASNVTYENVYLWNQSKDKPVVDAKVGVNDEVILILEGLNGLTEKEGMVFPVFSIELTDASGHQIIANDNILAAYQESGVDIDVLTKQLSATLNFSRGQIDNPCKLTGVLTDQLSDNSVEVTTEFMIK